MLKKTISYVDFNGNDQKEDFYFNLSKIELTELQVSVEGGMADWLKKVAESGSQSEMLDVFKNFIINSVGKKSDDGRRFVKNDEIREDFISSPAFDALFMELATDADKAKVFMTGIMPADMGLALEQELSKSEIEKSEEIASQ